MPDEAESAGLLALLLLTESRWLARYSSDGALIPLRDQDRSLWDQALIAEGHAIVRTCLRRNQRGPYQIQAAINAVHAAAAAMETTDWGQIVDLYDQLMAIAPTPVVAMNRAIALAEVRGPAAALEILDELTLDDYHLFHAARAHLLVGLGCHDEAGEAYARAAALATSLAERAFLLDRLDSPDS
jgi:RNA polymerase sigma-70 factor (ECF subfamily)